MIWASSSFSCRPMWVKTLSGFMSVHMFSGGVSSQQVHRLRQVNTLRYPWLRVHTAYLILTFIFIFNQSPGTFQNGNPTRRVYLLATHGHMPEFLLVSKLVGGTSCKSWKATADFLLFLLYKVVKWRWWPWQSCYIENESHVCMRIVEDSSNVLIWLCSTVKTACTHVCWALIISGLCLKYSVKTNTAT